MSPSMRTRSISVGVSSVVWCLAAAIGAVGAFAAGCGDDGGGANGTPDVPDGAAGTTDDGGNGSGEDGASGDGGGNGSAGGTFWYISGSARLVGVSDLAGSDVWSETLDDADPRALAIGAGSAWVLSESGRLHRYDAVTHQRTATIDAVAKNPSHLLFAAGAVWVAEDNDDTSCTDASNGPAKILRIDPATNAVAARIPVSATDSFPCNRFDGLRTDGTRLYALVDNAFGIATIDPATNTVVAHAPLGTGEGYGAGYLAIGDGTLWVHDTSAKTIRSIDPATLSVKSTAPVLDYLGERMVVTKTAVVLDKPGTSLLRVDVADPSKQEEKTIADSPDALVVHDGVLYATVRTDLVADLVVLDEPALTEKGRTELPPLSSIDEFVFVP